MKDVNEQLGDVKNFQKGSVLLTALLVMGVLMVITLGLSDLIIREIRIEADVAKSGQAYYAAEAGIEMALYKVHQGLPGIDEKIEGSFGDTDYFVDIIGRASTIPSFDEEKVDIDSFPDEKKFTPLHLNESVTIPLFYADENGKRKKVKNFYVAYYMDPFDLNLKAKPGSGNLILDDFDVLRWKVFGLRNNVQPYRTESVSDFISVGEDNTSKLPRCFGSKVDSNVCKAHANSNPNNNVGSVNGVQLPSVCSMTQARIFYDYDMKGDFGGEKQCYDLSNFLVDHDFNYLTLTNSANPLMIKNNKQGDSDEVLPLAVREKLATIYYKIIALNGDELPLNDVGILARGQSGDVTQDIQVNVGREQFLPVFNFSLYQASGK